MDTFHHVNDLDASDRQGYVQEFFFPSSPPANGAACQALLAAANTTQGSYNSRVNREIFRVMLQLIIADGI